MLVSRMDVTLSWENANLSNVMTTRLVNGSHGANVCQQSVAPVHEPDPVSVLIKLMAARLWTTVFVQAQQI